MKKGFVMRRLMTATRLFLFFPLSNRCVTVLVILQITMTGDAFFLSKGSELETCYVTFSTDCVGQLLRGMMKMMESASEISSNFADL